MLTKTVTFQRAYNYGAVLQTYALQKTLQKLGFDNEVIDYYDKNVFSWYKPLSLYNLSVVSKIKKICKFILLNQIVISRYNNFEKFISSNIKLSDKISDYNRIDVCNDNLVFITGSDQVWNSSITDGLSDYYTLNFIKNSKVKKISYAASVGDNSLIFNNEDIYKQKLLDLDHISVREKNTSEVLSKVLSTDVKTVLDPTLLLSKSDWDIIASNSVNYFKNEDYIFAYVVDYSQEFIKIVNYLSKKTGLRVVHSEHSNPGFINVLDSIYKYGPAEFVSTIKNAKYVVTTSFHATVFSIIYSKEFYVVPHKKTAIRVLNLLDMLKINNRTYNNLDEFINSNSKKINYDLVKKQLDYYANDSIEWLKNAIYK